jgi:hypothetical protein
MSERRYDVIVFEHRIVRRSAYGHTAKDALDEYQSDLEHGFKPYDEEVLHEAGGILFTQESHDQSGMEEDDD